VTGAAGTEAGHGPEVADRVLAPLWRALIGYRILAFGYACALVALGWQGYRDPGTAVVVLLVAGAWTAGTTVGYQREELAGRLAVVDLVLTVAAVASTVLAETPEALAAGAPVLTSVWAAGSPIALALARGPVAGILAALAVQATVWAVRGRLGPGELTDLVLLVAATAAIGQAARLLNRSAAEMRRAVEMRSAMAERERLARTIHDGVLQVLAQVHRRGRAAGGEAAELGELAGEQEVALRSLIAAGPAPRLPGEAADLATALAALATRTVTVSVPGTEVALPAPTVVEVVAATRAALANVAGHVGATAPAWVLLEDLGDRVLVSVRDDGPGIPDGRLVAAATEGRLGVAASIVGRIEALGGTAVCDSGPGRGTEWTFELARGRP
jgi:signal transduction histidine kinase